MEDTSLSPTHAFLDFDFSEFIDKNFDMSNDLFNSPNSKLSTTSPSILPASQQHDLFDDLLSLESSSDLDSKEETKTVIDKVSSNYTHDSPSLCLGPLWSSIEELAFQNSGDHKAPPNTATTNQPPTLSCIDDFIKDPHSDLVQLVEQCHKERAIFQNLITHGIHEHVSITPHQVLQQQQQLIQHQMMLQQQQQQQHEQQQKLICQQQQYQHQQQLLRLHQRQNFGPVSPQHPLQHPLDQQISQHLYNTPLHRSQHLSKLQLQQQQQLIALPPQQRKRKNNSSASNNSVSSQQSQQANKRVSKSSSYSSNNSAYTYSDSVNAQLLKELIRQASRNNSLRNGSMDSSNCSTTSTSTSASSHHLVFPPFVAVDYNNHQSTMNNNNRNYLYRHHPYYNTPSTTSSASSPSLSSSHHPRHNLPYHIQTGSNKKVSSSSANSTTKQQKNAVVRTTTTSQPSKSHSMGRPSMYSSDISQAQLLEIQAISRAQQDFIRAREQQEAEKEMMMKHQQQQQQQKKLQHQQQQGL